MFFFNLFKIRFIFKKPSKNNILLYDGVSVKHLNIFTKKYSVFYNRYEEINLYVLIYTILKNGFIELKQNYKINFFSFVSPKLIITFIDFNLGFYKLKKIYNNSKYMSVELLRKELAHYKKLKNKKIKNFSDYKFLLGKDTYNITKKLFVGKIFIAGNIYNNKFFIKKKNRLNTIKNFKLKNILFVPSFKIKPLETQLLSNDKSKPIASHFVKIFNFLCKISMLDNYNLFFLSKDGEIYENNYKNIFYFSNWHYISANKNNTSGYEYINNAHLIITDHSTLGYESLAKKKRTIFIPSKQIINNTNMNNSLLKSSLFVANPKYNIIKNTINELYNITDAKWNKKIKGFYNSAVANNPGNSILKKYIKKF